MLRIDVDPGNALAELILDAGVPRCESLAEQIELGLELIGDGVLRLSATSPSGLGAKRSIARCALVPTGPIDATRFPVTILEAESADGSPIPNAVVRAVPY